MVKNGIISRWKYHTKEQEGYDQLNYVNYAREKTRTNGKDCYSRSPSIINGTEESHQKNSKMNRILSTKVDPHVKCCGTFFVSSNASDEPCKQINTANKIGGFENIWIKLSYYRKKT